MMLSDALRIHPEPASTGQLAAYGALGFPLAFGALPLYVHLPHFYVQHVGLSLAAVGAVLLLARLADALIDPWLGGLSDAWRVRHTSGRRGALWIALPVFATGLLMLLLPPTGAGLGWLAGALAITYLGYSFASISYHAWGAELPVAGAQRASVTAWREGFALLGVVVAASIPALPGVQTAGANAGMQAMAVGFALSLLLAAFALHQVRIAAVTDLARPEPLGSPWQRAWQAIRLDPVFARLLAVLALSGLAAAVPATLVLFFVSDVLQRADLQGGFLAAYFIAAALGLPLWTSLSRRVGKAVSWAVSMAAALLCFLWAATLGAGDVTAFFAICVLTGLALGGELALPPAMLADHLAKQNKGGSAPAGIYFGLWNFVNKLNLALAAGLALPALALLGYRSGAGGADSNNLAALALAYAVLPAIIKTLALLALWRWRGHFRESST